MTNEEKVEKYFQEIENIFGTKEGNLNTLNHYDFFTEKDDKASIKAYDNLTLGRFHKEYWVKFEIAEPNLLNVFLMQWVLQGKNIAGVKGSVLDFGGVCDKRELVSKLHKLIDEL